MKPITETMMLGTSIFRGDETVNAHYIPSTIGGTDILLGYSLETGNGYALFGMRPGNMRVRIDPAYVETIQAAALTLSNDAFEYAASRRTEVAA